MNINATPETVRAATAAYGLARALDNRMGEPDQLRIAAWAEAIHPYRLDQADLLAGVRAHYDAPGTSLLMVGDLIYQARLARKDRTEREDDEVRDARQERLAVKVATEVKALAESMSADKAPPRKTYERPMINPLRVRCGHCGANPCQPCTLGGVPLTQNSRYHPARETEAEKQFGNGA